MVEEEKLTPVSRAATVVAYFTGTSGLASHAGGHNSSGVTRCLSSPLPATRSNAFRADGGNGRKSSSALIYGIARLYIQIRSPFRGDGDAPCTENGFCQGVTELFIYEIEHTG